jgi:alkaline phosphatase D
LKVAFTSCCHPRKHPNQPGWLQVLAHEPDVLLLIGDNVYLENHWWNIWVNRPVNTLSDEDFAIYLHERYQMQWQVPQFRTLIEHLHRRHTLILGTVDDHDFLGNDFCVTDTTQTKAKIARVLHRQFIDFCNHPSSNYPARPDWRSAQVDAEFESGLGLATHVKWVEQGLSLTVLDNRSYRQKVDKRNPNAAQALGRRQLDWLATCLQDNLPVKLVFSGSPLTDGTKHWARGSPLQDYPAEYKQLCELYRAQTDHCIIHVGGDLHYNDFKLKDAQNPCINLTSSGIGSGWQPFASSPNSNWGLIEWGGGQLSIRTFGNEPPRNVIHCLSIDT